MFRPVNRWGVLIVLCCLLFVYFICMFCLDEGNEPKAQILKVNVFFYLNEAVQLEPPQHLYWDISKTTNDPHATKTFTWFWYKLHFFQVLMLNGYIWISQLSRLPLRLSKVNDRIVVSPCFIWRNPTKGEKLVII